MRAFLAVVAHTTASGLNVVWVISVGKISWVPRSTRISHPLLGVSRHVVLRATVFCPPSPGLRNGTFGWRVTGELFARTLHLYSCSANFLSTWLCRHLKRPCVNATLHPDRICWRPALALLHRGHLSSLPNHWERFRGQGRVSYAALTRKLSCDCGVRQISAQVMTVTDVLPAGPCSLFALENSLDKVTVLFHLWK